MKLFYCVDPGHDDELFNHEFCNLIRLKHPNTVTFLGYCYETRTEPAEFQGMRVAAERTYRALCFEYCQNGSLDRYLCGTATLSQVRFKACGVLIVLLHLYLSDILIFADESSGLDWNTRYRIIKGTCEGLKYLHQGERGTYHLDLKPGNILLDTNMVPKLADFGLSRIIPENFTRITRNPYGTRSSSMLCTNKLII